MDNTVVVVVGCIAMIICVVILFIPAIIANIRNCVDRTAILLINIFFGFTVIGWIVALIWSITGETVAGQKKKYEQYRMQQMQQMQQMQTAMMQNAMMQMQNWNMANGGMQNGNMTQTSIEGTRIMDQDAN